MSSSFARPERDHLYWLTKSTLGQLTREQLRNLARDMRVERGRDKRDTIENLIASPQFHSRMVNMLLDELVGRTFQTSDGYKFKRTIVWSDGNDMFADRNGKPVDCNGYDLEGRWVDE